MEPIYNRRWAMACQTCRNAEEHTSIVVRGNGRWVKVHPEEPPVRFRWAVEAPNSFGNPGVGAAAAAVEFAVHRGLG